MDDNNGKKRPYIKPEIIYETDLEVRAGTPLSPGTDDPINLLNP
jgi:hypothetical protein